VSEWLDRKVWRATHGRIIVTTSGRVSGRFFRGRQVVLEGVLTRPERARVMGLFDYADYLARRGIYYQLRVDAPKDWQLRTNINQPSSLPMTGRFREWARTTLSRGLPPEDPTVDLIVAMTLGLRSTLDDELTTPFRRAGTMHLFAISGLHVALVGGVLLLLLRVLMIPRTICVALVVPALWFYAAVTGWQPSAVRATIMMSVITAGWLVRRPADLLNSVAGAAVLILFWDPRQLFSVGFQLSFSVVACLATLAQPISRFLQERLPGGDPWLPDTLRPAWYPLVSWVWRGLSLLATASLVAWLGALPWIAANFNLITPISLPSNCLMVPLATLALCSSLGSLVTGAWWVGGSIAFNHSAWLWMKLMATTSEIAAAVPGAWFRVSSPSLFQILLYYACLFAWLTGWAFKPERRGYRVGGLIVLTGIGVFTLLPWPRASELTVLPLPSGDGALYRAGSTAGDLLIDTGNSYSAEGVISPFLSRLGYDNLPTVIITHGDINHYGGLVALEAEFGSSSLITSEVSFRSSGYRALLAQAKETPGRWQPMRLGDQFGCWTLVHPAAAEVFSLADDNAMVLSGDLGGCRVLLCSDLGRAGQSALLARDLDLSADVMVSGIPTQGEPVGEPLLNAVQPQLVIISTSRSSARDRVSRDTRRRLVRHPFPTLYTSEAGAVVIRADGASWSVRSASGEDYRFDGRARPGGEAVEGLVNQF